MTLTDQQEALFQWVKEMHGNQMRKYTYEPYWYHLGKVAQIVYENVPIDYTPLTEVALCHDLLEDTEVDRLVFLSKLKDLEYDDHESAFILLSVEELTEHYTKKGYPMWSRRRRKAEEAALMVRISSGAQTVKYADIIDNISTIVEHDPRFAKTYIEEKELYIYGMDRGLEPLHRMAIDAIGTAKQKLTVNE